MNLFKLGSTICFILLISLTCKSQDFYLGLKGGYNRSSLEGSEFNNSGVDLENLHAWNIALTYNLISSNLPLGISIETGYTLKGTRTNVDSLDYRFHYLSFPVLIDFYPIEKLRISAGPEIGFLAAAKNEKSDTTKVDLLNTYDRRLELSGTVSASISVSYFADLGVRYNRSFTKISKMDALIDRKDLYNQYLQIFLHLKIAN